MYLFLKGLVVGRWRKFKFLSSASDEWSGRLSTSGQEFPHSLSPRPQFCLPLPQPRSHPSGSSSEGAVAVQNSKIFILRVTIDKLFAYSFQGGRWIHGRTVSRSCYSYQVEGVASTPPVLSILSKNRSQTTTSLRSRGVKRLHATALLQKLNLHAIRSTTKIFETLNTTPKKSSNTPPGVLASDHLIPIKGPPLCFILMVRTCVALHP